ncbi:alpha/beta hydrolase family esterase [Nocardia sp. NPDC058058]|uniref:extracellular catalytic domain type 1 short-chain-length polyhydroxyalkanoate depolymerase n=1 Tax=Nocardia sp. NPDC058058 TaxID=3346317 RepID=UPI0036DB1558
MRNHHSVRAVLARTSLTKALAAAMFTGVAAAHAEPDAQSYDRTAVFLGTAGAVSYQVHVPPAQSSGRALPLVVAVHGCGMTGYTLNSMKDMTDLNALADREGFLVVYPSQDPLRGLRLNCWNGDDAAHQRRGEGEPALIAGLTEQVITEFGADRSRVHVLGASSGAGIAVIMGVTYPDVYATVMSMAGGEYKINEAGRDAAGRLDPVNLSPVDTAERAFAEMGPRARAVPVMVVQGDQDTTVPPYFATRLVTHWAAIDDLAMTGEVDGPVDDVPESVVQVSDPNRHSYTYSKYYARGGDTSLIDYVLVNGMVHRWPGTGSGPLVDNQGPDLATMWWDWAKSRSMP